MITITFKTNSGLENMIGALDFAKGLVAQVDRNSMPTSEMKELIKSIQDITPYVKAELSILVKYTEVSFLVSNAAWILKSQLKDHDKGKMKLESNIYNMYKNSVDLFENFQSILDRKEREQNYKKDGSRRYNVKLEEKYNKSIGKDFKISFNYIEDSDKFTPKKGQIWTLDKYIKGRTNEDDATYDLLEIREKLTQNKFRIDISDFEAIAFEL